MKGSRKVLERVKEESQFHPLPMIRRGRERKDSHSKRGAVMRYCKDGNDGKVEEGLYPLLQVFFPFFVPIIPSLTDMTTAIVSNEPEGICYHSELYYRKRWIKMKEGRED